MELSRETILSICNNTGLTEPEVRILWSKSLQFNQILVERYGDTYNQNVDEICRITREYQQAVVVQLKRQREDK